MFAIRPYQLLLLAVVVVVLVIVVLVLARPGSRSRKSDD
jgi:hypothetical protein